MASTFPSRTSRTASSTCWPAMRPASSGSRERGAVCSLPRKTRSASRGPRATALATTSGPIPRGSPSVTASRGRRLEPDVDVRGATQQVEMVLDGELLAERFADAILYFVETQLDFVLTPHQLVHHVPRPR